MKNQKIIGIRRNDVKSGRFRHSNGPPKVIFEDIDFKFGTHIHRTSVYHIYSGFLKILEIFGYMTKFQNFEFKLTQFSKFSKI